jgi:hypothetical protein
MQHYLIIALCIVGLIVSAIFGHKFFKRSNILFEKGKDGEAILNECYGLLCAVVFGFSLLGLFPFIFGQK